MDTPPQHGGLYRFAGFTLDPARRELTRDGVPVPLKGRSFDVLAMLAANPGRLVTREELFTAVWPGRFVEDNNLAQAVSALRRALADSGLEAGGGDTLIVTVAGRGYRLAVPAVFEPHTIVTDLPRQPPQFAAPHPAPHRAWRAAAALAAACLAALLYWVWPGAGARPEAPPPHSIAVLPFANLTGDPAQDYIADGLAEDLIDSLGRIGEVRVAARRSAFSLRGEAVSPAEIGQRLHVATLLEGSLRRGGAGQRIDARLIDAASGYQLWSASFNPGQGDVLAVQDDIAAAAARALKIDLAGGEGVRFAAGGTTVPAALDAYLRGMFHLSTGDAGGLRAALGDFDTAVQRDGGFALAYVQRARVLESMTETDDGTDPARLRALQQQADEAARHAVALAPRLGVAHAALGRLRQENDLDFAGATAELAQARALAPGDAPTAMDDAAVQLYAGHVAEGLAAARAAIALDPLTAKTHRDYAEMLILARDYAGASEALRRAATLEPAATGQDRAAAAEIALARGDPAEALRLVTPARDWPALLITAIAQHALGHATQARQAEASLHGLIGDTGAMQYAELAAQWGDTAQALAWLAKAEALHDPGLVDLKMDWMLDPLRNNPAFQAMETRLLGTE